MIHIQKPSARTTARATPEEEEEEEDDSILDSDEDFDDIRDDGRYTETQREARPTLQPSKIVYPVTPRKRPSQELEPDDDVHHGGQQDVDGDVFMDGNTQDTLRRANNGTPPKRARVDAGQYELVQGAITPSSIALEEMKKGKASLPLPRTPGVLTVAGGEGKNE